jgi:hypothetical protein
MRMGENDKCELVWLYVGNWHFDGKIMTTIDIHTLGFKICFWKKNHIWAITIQCFTIIF